MKTLHLLTVSAAMCALLVLAAGEAGAQRPVAGLGPRTPPLVPRDHGGWKHGGKHHGFGGGIWIVERPFGYAQDREVPVIVEREVVVREVVPAAPPAPPPPPRKPFVVGKSYASLPGGCMKLIEGGASYYYCGGGEWYRAAGKQYRAVSKP